jgi:hypothetical protein
MAYEAMFATNPLNISNSLLVIVYCSIRYHDIISLVKFVSKIKGVMKWILSFIHV